jgi:hypothetical protein
MTNRQSSTPKPCIKARDLMLSLMEVDSPLEAAASGTMAIAPHGLTSAEQSFLNEHLFSCIACRVYQSDMQLLTESFDELDDVPVPDGLADCIMARIDFGAAASDATEAPVFESAPKTSGHLHGVPNTAASASNSLPRIGGAPSSTQGRPFTRMMVPVAAAVLLLALAVPQVTQWLQPGSTSGNKEVARTTTHSANSTASSATNKQLATLPNAISASQTPAPTAKGNHQSSTNNAVVALVPKPISPKGGVTGNNIRSAAATNTPAKATTIAPKKTQPAATKPQTVSKVVIATVPNAAQPVHRSAKHVTSDSVDRQELAYDPVTHLFGSNWAVDEFGNAVSSDATASKPRASEELATTTTHSSDGADESDSEDPVSSLVGF